MCIIFCIVYVLTKQVKDIILCKDGYEVYMTSCLKGMFHEH